MPERFRLQFQFLIGTLQTNDMTRMIATCKWVSIPHRYVTNQSMDDKWWNVEAFQFLIGTLQTENVARHLGMFKEFQFLIGTLQTIRSSSGGINVFDRFNSS